MSVWVKIAALGFMFFCILFNYTILRDTKVSLAWSSKKQHANLKSVMDAHDPTRAVES